MTTTRLLAAAALAVVAGTTAAQDAKPTPAARGADPLDLVRELTAAGFPKDAPWGTALPDFVRFGTPAAAAAHARGDRFDQLEADKAAAGHRAAVRAARYAAGGLPVRVTVPDDVEATGLVVEVPLPLRLRGRKPFYEDPGACSGLLARVAPDEASPFRMGFLTKEGTIRPCTPAEAALVVRRDGVVYHAEAAHTTLRLTLKGPLADLKAVARGAADYRAAVELTGLEYGRPLAWGWFRRDALADAGWDCQRLWIAHLLDDTRPAQPGYFVTAFGAEDAAKLPEFVRGTLLRLTLADKAGAVVAAYRGGADGPGK